MKRRINILFFVGALIFVLTGCGADNENHGLSVENPQKISVWNYYNGTQAVAFENMVNQFNAGIGKEKGIIVTAVCKGSVDELSNALFASIYKEVGAEELPNIIQCYKDTAITLDDMQLLVNLDTYVGEGEKALYVDSFIEQGLLGKEKEWKLFPIAKSTEVMVLNKQEWESFARDTGTSTEELRTWEGLAKAAEKYYNWSSGKAFFGRDSFATYLLTGSTELGHPICVEAEDGKVHIELDKETMRILWDNYYIPYIKGYYEHTGKFRTDDIKLGKIAAAVNSSTGCAYFPTEESFENQEPYPIDCMVLPIPYFKGTECYVSQQGADMAVLSGTESQEYASIVFLEWFTRPEQNIEFAVQTGYLPVAREACDASVLEKRIKETNTDLGNIDIEVLKTALNELAENKVYETLEFEESFEVRGLLNRTMLEDATADCKSIEEKMASGLTREEAMQPYLGEERFEKWYQELKEAMDIIMGEQ